MSLRVLYVITDSGVGGSERVLLNLVKLSDPKKIQTVSIVVLKEKRETATLWEKAGVRVVSLGMKRFPTPKVLFNLWKEIGHTSPDIVHAFLFHSVQLVRLVKWFRENFYLISSPRVNYRFTSSFAHMMDRILKGQDDLAVCESHATRQFLLENLKYEPSNVVCVPNGVDAEKYQFNPEGRKKWREQWKVLSREILIGAVGRFHPQKGFDVLLEAVSQLKNLPIPFKLVLVGEGPEESRLKELAKKYSLDVIFAGLQTDMVDIYSAFDIFVQSSRYEGMSNALLEAMSVGLPCAATAVDGTLDLANDGKNMFLVKLDDPIALSVALGYLLEKKDLREKLGQGARRTAEQFSIGSMVKAVENIYESSILKSQHN